jgi:superfamily I DNA/RNA helicase
VIVHKFLPTEEQNRVIDHEGSAFITACPGAGKTRMIVERARKVISSKNDGRGVALLSFTRGAISELTDKLRQESLLNPPVFPHYIDTFDGFIWQFLVAPFGIPGVAFAPRIIPDKSSCLVTPFRGVQPLPISCFDRPSASINADSARKKGFDVTKQSSSRIKAYETAAHKLLTLFYRRGELDFDDARELALARIRDNEFGGRLSVALAGRFREVIVDEAQDCNPSDLEFMQWLRDSGVIVKIVCDPDQAIYEFRGGVTDHLVTFSSSFESADRLKLRGNFRSSGNICKAIAGLRRAGDRDGADEPLGCYRDDKMPVRLLTFTGPVPAAVGQRFAKILRQCGIAIESAPVLAATRNSGFNAIGQPVVKAREDLALRLARAVSNFYFSFESSLQLSSIQEVHRVILEVEGRLSDSGRTYHQCIVDYGMEPNDWRPAVVKILRALRFDLTTFSDADAWHLRAKEILAPFIPPGGPSIAQKLKKNDGISSVLKVPPDETLAAKTIHSVKGAQFTSVCVVTIPQTFKGILDYLETGAPSAKAEMARELYVGASRAQRLLVIATPRSQADRFAAHLRRAGAEVETESIDIETQRS